MCEAHIITVGNIICRRQTSFKKPSFGRQKTVFCWRSRRDLNSRAGCPTYSLSRGAPSPLGYYCKILKMAERKGFEPLWVAPNGFQDRLVMTTSIPLRMRLNYFITKKVKCQYIKIENIEKSEYFFAYFTDFAVLKVKNGMKNHIKSLYLCIFLDESTIYGI